VAGFNPQQTFTFDPDTGEKVGEPIAEAFIAAPGPPETILTRDHAGTIRVVDLAAREPVGPPIPGLRTPGGYVQALPTGTGLVAAYTSGIQMSDNATGQSIGDPYPERGLGVASVSPSGDSLITFDGVHLMRWNLDQDTWAGLACDVAGRNLTRAEWAQYLPNAGPYRATCAEHREP
jgi:hypothetical protein